jgi:triosephosphate isomerase
MKTNPQMRTPIIAGNWKMNIGQVDQALTFVHQIRLPLNEIEGVDRVLCPPYTVLATLAEILLPTTVALGAQNMHWEEGGAHTGDISPTMLAGLCQYVILGHSERRASESIAEDNRAINRKAHAALSHGITPIICVGENLQQNEADETDAFISEQLRAALESLTAKQVKGCVIAYEPIWAIGTGKAATPIDANRTIGLTIRGTIASLYDETVAQVVRVQYGGSVNTENIASFMAMPEIDGALVGGASLKPDFVELVRSAAVARSG